MGAAVSVLRCQLFSSMSNVGRFCVVRTDDRFCTSLRAATRLSGGMARCVLPAEADGDSSGGSDAH